jgi:hypothetical protein
MVLVEHLVHQVLVLQEQVEAQEHQVQVVHQVVLGHQEVQVQEVLAVVRERREVLVHQEHQVLVQVGHQEVLVQVHQVPQELRVEHLH